MKTIQKIKIKTFTSVSGKLVPFTFDKKIPIPVKRIFFLYGAENKVRGDHAHKKCSQLFVAISGKMVLEVKTPSSTKTFIIEEKKKYGILVPPRYWCRIKFIKKKSILMVMNDRKYEFKDYLETFDSYKKYLKK
ncbi:FdtA/QdtA family cupin domain-containing protein [Pelagibacteraceae bacterium]|nr:FdtA/QdtA family cupin domain-containing protein [Pelagibacteraceae bacterium]